MIPIKAAAAPLGDWRGWLLTAVAAMLVWRTRLHLLAIMGAGAVLGMMGWV
jgi:chromate transporter